MNLEESDKFVEKQRQTEQKKKIVLASIVLCAILVVLLVIMIIYIQYQDSLQLKVFVDGTQVSIKDNLLYEENDVTYINVKSLAEIMGYTYTKGEYKKYNEDINSCYIRNDLEIVAMTVGSDIFTKYIDVVSTSNVLTPEGPFGMELQVISENGESNTYMLKNPMKLVDNEIYMPFDKITDVFNVAVNNSEKNRIRIYTLPALFKNAMEVAATLEYSTISGVYENIRAIPYGLIVVGDNGIYGAIDSTSGQEVLSIKYENIEFIQNVQEFFITGDNTVGLLDREGKTIIQPTEYDEMSVLDEINQLYLVEKNNKYGVLNRKGDIVVHVDYDGIGLKKIEDFNLEDVRNPNLLHDECIVVELDSLYGLFSIDGEELLKPVYEFGYKTTSTDIAGEDSVLTIPASTGIRGLVIQFNDLYGIYDLNVKDIIIPSSCTRIYSITKAAETKYYMEFANEQIELDSYLETYNLKSEKNGSDKTEETVAEPVETEGEDANPTEPTDTTEQNPSEEQPEEGTESDDTTIVLE